MTVAMLDIASKVVLRGQAKYPIYLVLDSPGGSIYAGDNFIQFAKTIRNLHTITMYSASMAAGIAQALPGRRLITEHGMFMFHRATTTISGQISEGELESRLANSKRLVRRMEVKNAKRIGITLQKYKQNVKDEWWLDAEKAILSKVADAIVDIHCSPALIKKKLTTVKRTFFGNKTITRSACPLIL
jgi:ATP-dependent protease ClpP protease subunit